MPIEIVTKSKEEVSQATTAEPGGVFISHVHEDAPLAQAFAQLVWDVTGGVVQTFSSTTTEVGGIQYGEEWFRWIRESVGKARHIVALITPTSVGRPWILFEAGLGKATPDVAVFGLCLGVSREDAYKGPFAVFQNCGTDEKELAKLCKELVQGTRSNPRDDMIRRCVQDFRANVDSHFAGQEDDEQDDDPTTIAVFQALEEMKLMLRDQSRMPSSEGLRVPREHDLDTLIHLFDECDTSSQLRLNFIAAYAAQLGMLWVGPLVEYIKDSPIPQLASRANKLHDLLERLCEHPDFRIHYALIHMMHNELERYVHCRMTRKAT